MLSAYSDRHRSKSEFLSIIINNIRFSFLLLISLSLLSGCASNFAGIKQYSELRPKDALVFGKIRIFMKGEDVTKSSNLIFNKGGSYAWSTARYYMTGDGVICASLPCGDNYFYELISRAGLFASEYRHKFQPTEVTFQVPQQGGAYYIGDIVIDWTPTKTGTSEAFVTGALYGGLIGGFISIGTMPFEGGEALIMVRNNLVEDQKLFHERLHSDKKLMPAFPQIKTAKSSLLP